jgi:hypothetical protein
MHNNKMLGVAITAALSMGMNTAVQAAAGDFTFDTPAAGAGNVDYAFELFPNSSAVLDAGSAYKVLFEASKAYDQSFYATFSLDSGGWGAALDSTKLVYNINTGTDTTPKIALVDKGDKGETEAKFLISDGGISTSNLLEFSFTITDSDNALQNSGGQIKLSADFKIAANPEKDAQTAPDPLTIANAAQGVGWNIDPDATVGEVAIDVTNNSKTFVGGLTDTMVKLGSFKLKNEGGKKLDLTSNFDFATDLPNATATLTINNGIFNASKDASGALDKEMVFIDYNCDGGDFDTAAGDLAATTLTDSTATWEIDTDPLHTSAAGKPIWTAGGADRCVVVQVDGETPIVQQGNAPEVVLSINFGNQTKSFPGKFRHIKRNGTTCWIYNVPNINALDLGFIRITNMSALDGVLKGELRNEAGEVLFTDVDLLEGATLGPNATTVIPHTKLAEFAAAVDPANEVWDRRAALIISSNLPEGSLEAFGLLRKSGTPGGPLMNISTGAAGNSCSN